MHRLLILAFGTVAASAPAQAEPVLQLSHLQHLYAGGGGCAERFWLEWRGARSEIRDIRLVIEIEAPGEESLRETLVVARLGTSIADQAQEAVMETPRCLSGPPRLVVRSATAHVEGRAVDLLKTHGLRIARVQRLPLVIGSSDERRGVSPTGKQD